MAKREELTTLEKWIVGVTAMAVLILVVCILLPPPGQVDEDVKDCLWILLAFDGVLAVVFAVHKGIDARFEKGDMSLTLTNDNDE